MELVVDSDTLITLGGLVVATFVLWFTARRNERETRTDLKTDIGNVRTELKADIANVRTELADTRTELKTDIGSLRTELTTDIGNVRTELADTRTELRAGMARLDDRVYALAARIAPHLDQPVARVPPEPRSVS